MLELAPLCGLGDDIADIGTDLEIAARQFRVLCHAVEIGPLGIGEHVRRHHVHIRRQVGI